MIMLCLLMMATGGNAADTTLINVYDANGNLISGDGQYYEYNDANQLVRVRQGDQNGTVVAEYFYDSTGQRVKKIENGVVTYYVGKHFEKQVGGSNAGSTSYYFAEGSERVAKKDPSGGVYYYHLDHLGGVNVVTNAAGTEVARSDYLPFGDTRSDSTGADKYSYTGKEKDKTDLYYFEARYNSPANRHFTQADVADPDYDDPQDLNRYAYVGNNPLSYVDYDGFKKKKKAKLSKREKYLIAHGRDPDKDKTSLKKAKKQEKNKSKLSDREEWMIAHGYDPDKDKTSLKQAKKREEEKQRALAALARQNPASSVQSGAGHSLARTSSSNEHLVEYYTTKVSVSQLTKEQLAYSNQCLADAAYYGALAEGYQHTIDVTKKATLGAITGVVMLFAAPAIGATVGVGYLAETVAFGIGDIAAEYNNDGISEDTMDAANALNYGRQIIGIFF